MSDKPIPVFTSDFCILGYLDRKEVPSFARGMAAFRKVVVQPVSVAPDVGTISLATSMAHEITFLWDRVTHPPRGDDHRYIVDVLVVQKEDALLLDNVRGFKWFAEEHGEATPALAKIGAVNAAGL